MFHSFTIQRQIYKFLIRIYIYFKGTDNARVLVNRQEWLLPSRKRQKGNNKNVAIREFRLRMKLKVSNDNSTQNRGDLATNLNRNKPSRRGIKKREKESAPVISLTNFQFDLASARYIPCEEITWRSYFMKQGFLIFKNNGQGSDKWWKIFISDTQGLIDVEGRKR